MVRVRAPRYRRCPFACLPRCKCHPLGVSKLGNAHLCVVDFVSSSSTWRRTLIAASSNSEPRGGFVAARGAEIHNIPQNFAPLASTRTRSRRRTCVSHHHEGITCDALALAYRILDPCHQNLEFDERGISWSLCRLGARSRLALVGSDVISVGSKPRQGRRTA